MFECLLQMQKYIVEGATLIRFNDFEGSLATCGFHYCIDSSLFYVPTDRQCCNRDYYYY